MSTQKLNASEVAVEMAAAIQTLLERAFIDGNLDILNERKLSKQIDVSYTQARASHHPRRAMSLD